MTQVERVEITFRCRTSDRGDSSAEKTGAQRRSPSQHATATHRPRGAGKSATQKRSTSVGARASETRGTTAERSRLQGEDATRMMTSPTQKCACRGIAKTRPARPWTAVAVFVHEASVYFAMLRDWMFALAAPLWSYFALQLNTYTVSQKKLRKIIFVITLVHLRLTR